MVVEISRRTLPEFDEILKVLRDSPLHKKGSFALRISSVSVSNPQFPAGLITFTEEILSGKFHFLLQWAGFKNIWIRELSSLKRINCGNLVKKNLFMTK